MDASNEALLNIKICERELASYQWVGLGEVGDWIKTRARGTQLYLAQYIQKLHEQGYKFNQRNPNKSAERICKFKMDNIVRKFVEHMLV